MKEKLQHKHVSKKKTYICIILNNNNNKAQKSLHWSLKHNILCIKHIQSFSFMMPHMPCLALPACLISKRSCYTHRCIATSIKRGKILNRVCYTLALIPIGRMERRMVQLQGHATWIINRAARVNIHERRAFVYRGESLLACLATPCLSFFSMCVCNAYDTKQWRMLLYTNESSSIILCVCRD